MDKIFITELKIIINKSLYQKKKIDENTFRIANDILLRELKNYNIT